MDADDRIRFAEEEARRLGFEAGLADGRHAALCQERDRLGELGASLLALERLRGDIVRASEADLLELAVRIAEVVVRERIARDDAVVVRALGVAVADVPHAESFTVRCHPDDEPKVAAALASTEGSHSIRADASVARGGCLVESSAGDVDVRIETQLRILEHELLSRS